MAASDHLGTQFEMFHPDEIGFLKSRDYAGQLRDIDFAPGGESDQRVKAIMESARTEGIREPLQVKDAGGGRYLDDGHHRYVAARRLGIKVPMRGM